VPRVHQVLQPRTEEVVLRHGLGLLRAHRRLPCRVPPTESRPVPRRNPQFTSQGSAPRSRPNLQNRILPERRKNRRKPPRPAYFTADYVESTSRGLDGVTGRPPAWVAVVVVPQSDGVVDGVGRRPTRCIIEGRPWSTLPGSMSRWN
jgi:hypothetical protein